MATYSTTAQVKDRLPPVQGSEFDTKLERCREQAYVYINTKLDTHEGTLTTPLAAPGNFIINVEADYAAGLFLEEQYDQTAELPPVFSGLRKRAKEDLKTYIEETYMETRNNPPTVAGIESYDSNDPWEYS